MRFDDTDHNIDTGLLQARGLEHGEGLAYAGRRAEEHLQPALRLLPIGFGNTR
jgi:hypothetical protein